MVFFYFYFYRRKVDSILVYDFVLKYVSFFVTISLITPVKTNSIKVLTHEGADAD